MPYDASPGAVRSLLRTFWSSAGWQDPPKWPDASVFEAAIASGLMFRDPVRLDHDGWVDRARAAVAATSAAGVGDAFVASLTSRRLDLRSALGSFALARHLPAHSFEPSAGERGCAVCGLLGHDERDLNVLNFERFKWGGVRRLDIAYAAFDLEQFVLATKEPVSDAAIAAGRALIDGLRSAAPTDTATKVAAQVRSFRANKDEREVVLDILGVCGVLRDDAHAGFRENFTRYDERPLPDDHFTERAYPACWWRAGLGLDESALQELLPRLV